VPTTHVCLKTQTFEVYIGRKEWCPSDWDGPGADGTFGNPVGTVDRFEDYFHGRLQRDPAFRAEVEGLRGKHLGCFCRAGKRCHGDVIIEHLDGAESASDEDVIAAMARRLREQA